MGNTAKAKELDYVLQAHIIQDLDKQAKHNDEEFQTFGNIKAIDLNRATVQGVDSCFQKLDDNDDKVPER